MFNFEYASLLSTAGLVYISYVGVTNVASLAEEVKDPEKNLPFGVILALSTAFWDSWLRNDSKAEKWLEGDGPITVLEKGDRWQKK